MMADIFSNLVPLICFSAATAPVPPIPTGRVLMVTLNTLLNGYHYPHV